MPTAMTYCCLKILTARTISLYWPFLNLRRGYSAARHQCSKIDAPDLLRVLSVAFSRLAPRERLWPMSGQTLRLRFKAILTALNLTTVHPGMQSLDLASLRPGGATWLLQVTEQSELVRRRGRWVTAKVMEVYLQEMSAARYLNCLDDGPESKTVWYGLWLSKYLAPS